MKKRPFPRLSRGGKILRNLLLTLMLAVFLWGLNDFRVPGLRPAVSYGGTGQLGRPFGHPGRV